MDGQVLAMLLSFDMVHCWPSITWTVCFRYSRPGPDLLGLADYKVMEIIREIKAAAIGYDFQVQPLDDAGCSVRGSETFIAEKPVWVQDEES